MSEFNYDAFISYRHNELDMEIAKKVHKGLETFKVPKSVQKKTGKKKIQRVFRDQEELPIGSDLGHNITTALENSSWLIVICSPRLPQSYWCLTEIETFIKMHDRDHVLAVLVEGEPDESFPEILLKDENGNPVEPLAADVRGATKKERNKKFQTEIIRLCAPLLGVNYDDLRQRHRERRMKKIIALSSTAAVLVAALGISFGIYNANKVREIKENQSRFLAETSADVLATGDREDAGLIALAALPSDEDNRPLVAEAENALSNAVNAYSSGSTPSLDRQLKLDVIADDITLDNDGCHAVVVDSNNTVYLFDTVDGNELLKIYTDYDESHYPTSVLAGYYNEDALIIVYTDYIKAYDLSGNLLYTIDEDEDFKDFYTCDFNYSTNIIAGIDYFNSIKFYDGTTGEKISSVEKFDWDIPLYGGLNFSEEAFSFSQNGKFFSIPLSVSDSTVGYSVAIDIYSGETTVVSTPLDHCLATYVTSNDELITVTADGYTTNWTQGPTNRSIIISGFDLSSGELLWSTDASYQYRYGENYNMIISYYNSNEIYITSYDTVYFIDTTTGKITNYFSAGQGILAVMSDINSPAGYGYLALSDGDIAPFTYEDGVVDATYVYPISTGKDLLDTAYSNNVFLLLEHSTPAVTLMKFNQSDNYTCIASGFDTISGLVKSDDDTYYCLRGQYLGDEVEFYFYDATTDEEISKVTWPSLDGYTVYTFIDDENFLYLSTSREIYLYNLVEKSETTLSADLTESDSFAICKPIPRTEFNVAYIAFTDHIDVIDYTTGDLLNTFTFDDDEVMSVLPGYDETTVFAYLTFNGLVKLDLDTNTYNPIDSEGIFDVSKYLIDDGAFTYSNNSKYLAIACTDSTLRILDVETLEVVHEIPFVSNYYAFVKFSDDNTKLYYQGYDKYLKAYDLQKDEVCYTSTTTINNISGFRFYEDQGIIAVRTMVGDMLVLDYETLGCIATVEDGLFYFPKTNRFLCYEYDGTELFSFDYLSLEDLKERFSQQFPNATLTEAQKLKYYIE